MRDGGRWTVGWGRDSSCKSAQKPETLPPNLRKSGYPAEPPRALSCRASPLPSAWSATWARTTTAACRCLSSSRQPTRPCCSGDSRDGRGGAGQGARAHRLGGGSDAAESDAAAAESGAYEEVCGAWWAEVQECPCELLRISSLPATSVTHMRMCDEAHGLASKAL